MPATGTIQSVWASGGRAYASVRVEADDAQGAVEYTASTPLRDEQGVLKSKTQLRAELVAATKAQRDAQRAGSVSPVTGITGTVDLG